MKTSYLALLAAFFLGPSAADKQIAPEPAPALANVAPPLPEVVPLGPVVEVPENTPAPAEVVPEMPADMRVIVNSKGGAKSLTLVHPGHLLTLRRGDTVVLGDNSVSIPIKEAESMSWESAERQTFTTLRGVVEWEVTAGSRPTPSLRATSHALPTREVVSARHACKAFDGSKETVTVLCRVESLAVGAARAFGDKPQQGIAMVEVGERRYFRMELDLSKNEFDAVVIGYSDGIRGHVIRAEASKLPGETKASLSLSAAARTQPFRIIRRFHHHPHHFRHEVDFL